MTRAPIYLCLFMCIGLPVLAQTHPRATYPQPLAKENAATVPNARTKAPSPDQSSTASTQIDPLVRVEIPEGDIIVGQPVVVRLTVLVPTYMPKPPVYPNFEVPNLMVRLPERATQPISERIDGNTWSGTTRSYRLYPLVAGDFEITAQDIVITFSDPTSTGSEVQVNAPIEPIRFTAILPAGAQSLSPPIVAQGFTLKQDVEGQNNLASGDAFTRRITATIRGTTAVLIPELIPALEPGPLRAYPKSPRISETEDRGELSGTRQEETVYIAQDGGTIQLPEVSFQWFNLQSQTLETATVDRIELVLASPPQPPIDTRSLVVFLLILLSIFALAYLIYRRYRLAILAWAYDLHDRMLATERQAYREVLNAIHQQNLGLSINALKRWKTFYSFLDTRLESGVVSTLTNIGEKEFNSFPLTVSQQDWMTLKRSYLSARRDAIKQNKRLKHVRKLPKLNPTGMQ
jgi:hypothetical protein